MSFGAGSRIRHTDHGFMRSLTTFDSSEPSEGLGRLIPRPDIPIQPVLSWGTFATREAETAPAVTDNGRTVFVTAARIAIAQALMLAGVGPGHKVLVPAYHCIVMVEPIESIGAQPVFYALRDDLSVDLDDVARKLDADTRAFIAVNYFGFPQDLLTLRRFCDQRGLIFVEDCAHSFFGTYEGRPLGTFGDFAVASLVKFFPVRDGGCLVIGAGKYERAPIALQSQGAMENLAAIHGGIEDAVAAGRLMGLGPVMHLLQRGKSLLRSAAPKTGTGYSDNPAQQRSGQRGGFDSAWLNRRVTATSRLISHYASRSRIVTRRRRNYARLLQEFSNVRGCRPIFPHLPAGVVPYMFPLSIDNLPEIFPTLEDRAVPMQRFGQFLWPDMDAGVCAVTQKHSRHSLQLACHQELSDTEIIEIASRVRAAVA